MTNKNVPAVLESLQRFQVLGGTKGWGVMASLSSANASSNQRWNSSTRWNGVLNSSARLIELENR